MTITHSRTRFRRPMLAALAVAAAVALPSAVNTSEAAAIPAPILDGGGGQGCYYGGQYYSDGSVKRHDDGVLYRCVDGSWRKVGAFDAVVPEAPAET